MFDSALPNSIKDVVLKDSIKIYVKLRAHAHAKHLIENHKSASRKQRKEKALRKKLKLSSNDKQLLHLFLIRRGKIAAHATSKLIASCNVL